MFIDTQKQALFPSTVTCAPIEHYLLFFWDSAIRYCWILLYLAKTLEERYVEFLCYVVSTASFWECPWGC